MVCVNLIKLKKLCSKCKGSFPLSFFSRNQGGLYGLHSNCRKCVGDNGRKWYLLNTERCSEKDKKNYLKNRKKRRARQKEYEKEQREVNPVFRLKKLLRNRIHGMLIDIYKVGSAVRDMGCNGDQLKTYVESKFWPGMSWEEQKKGRIHIDHIIPLSAFNIEDRKDFLLANHFTNLQPLWAEDNQRKNDCIPTFLVQPVPFCGMMVVVALNEKNEAEVKCLT